MNYNITSESGWINFMIKPGALLSILLVGLLLYSCAAELDEVRLGYVEWDSEIASTHVVAAVLMDRLDREVNIQSAEPGPMWAGIARGDFDAIVSAWLPATHQTYWDSYGVDVVDLGPNLEDARIGWVVPAYTPINSITELNDFSNELGGRVVGIDPGAGLMQASEQAIEHYGINLRLVEGSGAAMAAALSSAIRNNEHIVVAGWTPHWKFASFDLKYLDDPDGIFGDAEAIHTIVTPQLEEQDPEVFSFLDNFYWTNEDIGQVMVMIEEGMAPMEAARAWISENEDKVDAWLETE